MRLLDKVPQLKTASTMCKLIAADTFWSRVNQMINECSDVWLQVMKEAFSSITGVIAEVTPVPFAWLDWRCKNEFIARAAYSGECLVFGQLLCSDK